MTVTTVVAAAVNDAACFRIDVRNLSSDRTVSVAADGGVADAVDAVGT